MRPNPFLLGPLCLALIAAILLIGGVTPPPTAPPVRLAPAPIAVGATHRTAGHARHPWRDAAASVARMIARARHDDLRPTIAGTAARFSHWAVGHADDARLEGARALSAIARRPSPIALVGAARREGTAALGAARTRAVVAASALRQFGARLGDGRRRTGQAIDATLRRLEEGAQGGARAIAGAVRAAPWNR